MGSPAVLVFLGQLDVDHLGRGDGFFLLTIQTVIGIKTEAIKTAVNNAPRNSTFLRFPQNRLHVVDVFAAIASRVEKDAPGTAGNTRTLL